MVISVIKLLGREAGVPGESKVALEFFDPTLSSPPVPAYFNVFGQDMVFYLGKN